MMKRFLLIGLVAFIGASYAQTIPEEVSVNVKLFSFPQAALTGFENDAERYAIDFRNQLVLACQRADYIVTTKEDEQKVVEERVTEEDSETPKDAQTEEVPQDDLMAVVAEQEKKDTQQNQSKPLKKETPYILSGNVTAYEDQVGKAVKIGSGTRQKISVHFATKFKVQDQSGTTLLFDHVSVSLNQVVSQNPESALKRLNKKAFTEAARQIVQKISGHSDQNEESLSDDDYYADSPGKRLKTDKPLSKAMMSNHMAPKRTEQSKTTKRSQKTSAPQTSQVANSHQPTTFERDGKVVTKWVIR